MGMPESDKKDTTVSSDKEASVVEPFRNWERIFAISLGLLTGGAGGYAVFVSTNQAGTAALLILSAIFSLIGIQGTPLIRFTSGSNSFELDRRKRGELDRAVEEAKEENNLDRAAGIVQGAAIAQPRLVGPRDLTLIYVQKVKTAIMELGYQVTESSGFDFNGFDLTVLDGQAHTVYVELKYYRGRVPTATIYSLVAKGAHTAVPVLLVANQPLTKSAELAVRESDGYISAVVWNDERDNRELEVKLQELFATTYR
jgi:hypothetical protein